MQRLFSTFPDGWPGRGLLLLRFGAGLPLIYLGICGVLESLDEPIKMAGNLLQAAAGVLLVVGLWTPLAGTLMAIDESWIAFSIHFSQHGENVFLAVLSAAAAMLGPGAWSVDARLFGRKVFDMGDQTRR